MTYRSVLPRLALPPTVTRVSGTYWRPTEAFVQELAEHLRGKRVLEIFSGNGYLAALLQARGVDVRATTRLSGHDSHAEGLYCDVEELEACQAVLAHGAHSDVLLVCWPTATEATLQAALRWGTEKFIVFVGEVTDYAKGHLAGCASDAFFERIAVTHRFETYHGNVMEAAFECRLQDASPLLPRQHWR